MAPGHWIIFFRRFKITYWSHVERLKFPRKILDISTFEGETTGLSLNIRHDLPSDAVSTAGIITEVRRVDENKWWLGKELQGSSPDIVGNVTGFSHNPEN
jgi:hypothetical protein